MAKLNSKGFAAIETFLVLVVLAIVGFTGWFVLHSQRSADKTYQNTDNSSASEQSKKTSTSLASTTPANSNTKYLVIKEWGVKVGYESADTLSYTMAPNGEGNDIYVTSANLAKTYDCTTMGAGEVSRISSAQMTTEIYPGYTFMQDYQTNPKNYARVGGYYLRFMHDQGWCANTDSTPVNADAQNAANAFTLSLMPEFQAE